MAAPYRGASDAVKMKTVAETWYYWDEMEVAETWSVWENDEMARCRNIQTICRNVVSLGKCGAELVTPKKDGIMPRWFAKLIVAELDERKWLYGKKTPYRVTLVP